MSLEDETLTQRGTVHPFHDQGNQDHDHDENMSNVLVAKGVTMVILCTVSITMGILPMQVAKRLKWNTSGVENPSNDALKVDKCCDRSTRLVSLLLGFGGGVLFCTTFLHLLPEVKEGLEHLTAEGKLPELSFSLAETLTCAGFFIMYLVEESVHTHLRKKQARREGSSKDVTKSTNELVENGQTLPNCVHVRGSGGSQIRDSVLHRFGVSCLEHQALPLGDLRLHIRSCFSFRDRHRNVSGWRRKRCCQWHISGAAAGLGIWHFAIRGIFRNPARAQNRPLSIFIHSAWIRCDVWTADI
ncbi:unnamed protein product, partial [Heterotrigona itama]